MATEVVSTIRSSGGDYTSLSAWEAGEQGDLTGVRDEIAIAECYDDWASGLSGSCTIDGWTTDSTRYVKVTVASGHRHNGIDPTSGFYLVNAGNFQGAIATYEAYTVVEYVGHIFSTYTDCTGFWSRGGTQNTFRNCISTDTAVATNNRSFWAQNSSASDTRFICCMSRYAATGFFSSNSGWYQALNCVAADCTTGFLQANVSDRVKNCVSYGNTTNYSGSGWHADSTHNATSSASDDAPGGNSQTSVGSSDFVDAANGDFHIVTSSTKLYETGTDLSGTFTTDIDDDTWASTWSIGFDQPDAGGGAVTGVGSSVGAATASAVGASLRAAAGSSTGAATAAAVGASLRAAEGSSAGAATAAATGTALVPAVGSSAGSSTAAATGTTSTGSTGASAGVATAAAVGASLRAAAGASAGVATAAAVGASLRAAAGSSAGSATAAAVGDSVAAGQSTGSAAGSSTAAAVGSLLWASAAAAAGTSTAAAVGASLRAAAGTAAGTSTAAATSTSDIVLTLEQKCDLMLKLLLNKQVTDPNTGVMTIYDDDDVTPLYTANVYEDAAGTVAYRGQGIERRNRFEAP